MEMNFPKGSWSGRSSLTSSRFPFSTGSVENETSPNRMAEDGGRLFCGALMVDVPQIDEVDGS